MKSSRHPRLVAILLEIAADQVRVDARLGGQPAERSVAQVALCIVRYRVESGMV
jgi:hypothetical protein